MEKKEKLTGLTFNMVKSVSSATSNENTLSELSEVTVSLILSNQKRGETQHQRKDRFNQK
jgi:hypothetical protein